MGLNNPIEVDERIDQAAELVKKYQTASMDRFQVEKVEGWRDWARLIPKIPMRPKWSITAVPPFAGAMARFFVSHDDAPDSHVSIYLDTYDVLGVCENPYWEIYPDVDGENARYELFDIIGLTEGIAASLLKQVQDLNDPQPE